MAENKPRIALFTSNLRGGGAQRMMLHLAEGFSANGFSVDLVLLDASGDLKRLVPKSSRLINLKSGLLTGTIALARYLKREQPDVLLSTITGPNIIALLARKLAGAQTRIIVRQENLFSRKPWPKNAIAAATARRLYTKADGIVAISKYVARELSETAKIPPAKISVLYNPVIMRKPAAGVCPHPWLARGQPPVIMSAGYFTGQKDFPTLIRAFQVVRKQRPARLVLLGEGPLRKKLERLARGLGIGNDVMLPGFVHDAPCWMSRAAVFAFSSAWEGFGNVLVEALSHGIPVVSADCGTAGEILEDGKYGRIVPVGDERALADGILETLDKPQNRAGLRQRAQEFSAARRMPPYVALVKRTLRNI